MFVYELNGSGFESSSVKNIMSDNENSSEYCSESKSEGIGRSSESELEREYLKSEQVFS